MPLSMKNASDPIPSHRRCPESVHAKTGKDASNSYSRDGKAKGRSGQLAYSRH